MMRILPCPTSFVVHHLRFRIAVSTLEKMDQANSTDDFRANMIEDDLPSSVVLAGETFYKDFNSVTTVIAYSSEPLDSNKT